MFYVEQFFWNLTMVLKDKIAGSCTFLVCCIFRQRKFFVFAVLCLFTLSCEKPMDNPELVDPIYNDLLNDAKTSVGLATTEEKNLESLNKDIEALKAGDNSRKNKMRQRFESETKITGFKQRAQYFQLRGLKRKEYVLDNYPKYFAKHLPWPDSEEWHDYQASKKLQMASRDWGTRVPKLGKRIKEYNASAAAAYSGGGKAEGAKKESGESAPEKGSERVRPEGQSPEKSE